MKRNSFLFSLFIGLAALLAFTPIKPDGEKPNEISIGQTAPGLDLTLTDVNGKSSALRSLAGKNGLLVVFSCNTCPFVIAWEDRYNELYELAKANDVNMILVNSNEAKRDGDDAVKAMAEHAKKMGYKAPYLVDKDHKLADAFGARTTPHVFLFNSGLKLAYKGSIDDNFDNKAAVKETYLKDAITSMVANKAPSPAETKAVGCSIKRVKS